jgi:acyl-coenzyme A thioesterase PaaI-like protein
MFMQTLTDVAASCNVTRCQFSVTATQADSEGAVPTNDSAARMRQTWEWLRPLPGGRWLFSRLLGWMTPYTGSVHPEVLELDPGFARIRMRDRRRVRNHLRSIHAIALTNLAEVTSGLAMTAALPATIRGIVVRITIDFEKKARGTLTAECRCVVPAVTDRLEFPVTAVVRDQAGEIVARATVHWLLAPRT